MGTLCVMGTGLLTTVGFLVCCQQPRPPDTVPLTLEVAAKAFSLCARIVLQNLGAKIRHATMLTIRAAGFADLPSMEDEQMMAYAPELFGQQRL